MEDDPEQQVIVVTPSGVDMEALAADHGATVLREEYWGCATMAPPPNVRPDALAASLACDPRVISAERNGRFEFAESRQQSFGFDDGLGSPQAAASQPAADLVGLRAAQQVSRGQGTLVAVLDTGVDPTHPLLAGRVVAGRDYVDGDADPTDRMDGMDDDGDHQVDEAFGHGTHVAGIVALAAPGARILAIRVLDADGRGDMRTVASGLYHAIVRGARVINLSLGSLRPSAAVEYMLAQAERAGVVTVVSAGNWGSNQPAEFPATSDHALAVAACDNRRVAAPFTSYGSFVGLTAPGVEVRSAFPDDRWMKWSGTSMSAPFVAGTAALLIALHPDWSQGDVEARLAGSAAPVTPLHGAMLAGLGAGALDAAAALAPDHPGPGEPAGGDPLKRLTR
jgi:subtilisin family serine protease